jgi:Fe-S oxidoreductase
MKMEKKREPEACILCGLCNGGGDAYNLSLDERRSPRHAVWSCRKGRIGPALYAATLNSRPEELCPVGIGIDAAVIAARRKMVKVGQETVANRDFMAKLREGRNPHK